MEHKLKPTVIWEPQPGPQTALIACPVFEIFFGGARGGGKTEASIGDWLAHADIYGQFAIGLFVRRAFVQLAEVIARTKVLFPLLGAKYNEKRAEWKFPNGARLKFAYLERDEDASAYQGHNYTRLYVEEITDFPNPDPIMKLKATLRSANNVPVGMRATGNPGGPGHNWVKARYIDPAPQGYKEIVETEVVVLDGVQTTVHLSRVFIPSKLTDNRKLLNSDPTYIIRLRQSGSEQLVQAWLHGRWDVVDGAYFNEFNLLEHVLDFSYGLKIPRGAIRFRSFDWGYAKPFSVGWYAVSDGTWGLPKGAIYKYREWYGKTDPNKGLYMNAAAVAKGIRKREQIGEVITYSVADPAVFTRDGGPSIAEEMNIEGVQFRKADNKRIPGWQQVRIRMKGENGVPMLYFSEECFDTIRTLPALQHDKKDMEDLDTDGEDHAADELRYAVMSRPWLPSHIPKPEHWGTDITDCSINQIVQSLKQKRIQRENYE